MEKALDVCEALASAERGLSVSELARRVGQPAPTVHRLLAILKRRSFVRQDDETSRYSLTLKMLDLSFRLLGRSELRLHAYPVLRDYVLRTGVRAFLAVPALGEVTYLWTAGPDDVGMHTAYGREMPVHCSIYVDAGAKRRLSCFKVEQAVDLAEPDRIAVRFGAAAAPRMQRLVCTCAPVHDYTGRQVARVGLSMHAVDDRTFAHDQTAAAMDLARRVSVRLGYLPAVSVA